ncbi:hypothetical protein C815_01688 [Firmicutes bacterium M10-2]|nr:hypothetical protein C815_01688 [Firmicutes bacterium M10-2]
MSYRFTNRETNIVKGFAILFMYVHHFYLDPSRYKEYDILFLLGQERVTKLAVFFKICVAIFMFLSGYGMYVSAIRKEKSTLWKAMINYSVVRYVKLIFPFFFIFWLSQLIFYPTGRYLTIYGTGTRSLLYVLIDMFGFADLLHTPTFLGTWWYIGLISLVIWSFPILFKAFYKYPRIFSIGVLMACCIPSIKEINYIRWLPVFVMGMIFARYKVFEKIAFWIGNQKKSIQFIIFIIGVLLLIGAIYFRMIPKIPVGIKDLIATTIWISFIAIFFVKIRGLNKIMEALGIHSMTMFLTHTFIRTTYFQDFSYGFYYAGINLIVFTIVTYMIALGIDLFRKQIGYDRFINKVAKLIMR